MSTEGNLQPTLELLSSKVAAAQYDYLLAVVDLFKKGDRALREMVVRDMARLMDAHCNRGVSQETVSDLIRITQLVKEHGWSLFDTIDETRVTEGIDGLRHGYQLTLGGAATLFYTRTTIEPARCMMGRP